MALPDRLVSALVGRYTLQREIGRGGMATVYLAEDPKHHRKVAVKVLDPEVADAVGPDRFFREIEVAARLTYPHILPLFDSGEANGFLYFVMPYLRGQSLRSRLERERQLPIEDAVQIAREIGDSLAFAHREDVIHRDDKRLTRTGVSLGTPAYMSPEQALGEGTLDGRADQYALGCVLFEMLTGEPPHAGFSAQAMIAKRLSERVPRVSVLRDTVPADLEAAVSKALARLPADRFGTISRFTAALSAFHPMRQKAAPRPRERASTPIPGQVSDDLKWLIGHTRLSMKNDIIYLAFQSSDQIVNTPNEIGRRIPRDSDEVFVLNQGAGEVIVICESHREKLLQPIRDQAVDHRPAAAVLRIEEARDHDLTPSIEVPGLYAYFINQLAANGINILDLVSTRRQPTVIVSEDQVATAFSVLSERVREHRAMG